MNEFSKLELNAIYFSLGESKNRLEKMLETQDIDKGETKLLIQLRVDAMTKIEESGRIGDVKWR